MNIGHQLYSTDYVFKYWPRYDLREFQSDIFETDAAFCKYFPESILKQMETFKMYKMGALVASVAILGGLTYKLQKFPLIRRITTPWVPGVLKVGILLGGAYIFNSFLEDHINLAYQTVVYQQMRHEYKKYKFSGDMRELNNNIQFQELPQNQ